VDAQAVVEAVRVNVSGNDICTAPQGIFVSVSIGTRPRNPGPRLARQVAVEFAVACGFSLLVLAIPLRSLLHTAGLLGLVGLIAGIETHFPNWNWSGFPTSYLLAGSAYLAANWFLFRRPKLIVALNLTGLVLGAIRRKLEAGASRR
jgi:hypothetical protein